MKILHLDDDDLRHELFKEWAEEKGHTSFHAHTIDEFAGFLDTDKRHFDVVFLDHDLNDFQYRSGMTDMYGDGEINGQAAARMLVDLLPEHRPSKVIIHSWNPTGAHLMRTILEKGGFTDIEVIPFDQEAYFERLVEWKQANKEHYFLQIVAPEEKLDLIRWKNENIPLSGPKFKELI